MKLCNEPEEDNDEEPNYGFLEITEEERIEINNFFDELDYKQSIDDRI